MIFNNLGVTLICQSTVRKSLKENEWEMRGNKVQRRKEGDRVPKHNT
jgi:hypothetical protein